MEIDPLKDTLIRLSTLASDRGVHAATVYRWKGRGVGGVRLKAIRVGGVWYTTWAAFADFCRRLSENPSEPSTPTTNDGASADAELDASKW